MINTSQPPVNPAPAVNASQSQPSQQKEWKGLTIDELKMRRAKSLVIREINRTSLAYQFNNARDNVSQNGIRGLLFSDNTIVGLKKADYLLLGAKAIGLLLKHYSRRKR